MPPKGIHLICFYVHQTVCYYIARTHIRVRVFPVQCIGLVLVSVRCDLQLLTQINVGPLETTEDRVFSKAGKTIFCPLSEQFGF